MRVRRNDEAAAQHANGQRRQRLAPGGREQFLKAFGLAGVVAENHRRRAVGHDGAQTRHVAFDGLRRPQREEHTGVGDKGRHDGDGRIAAQAALGDLGWLQELIARGRVLAAAARQIEMVRRLVPRAPQLGLDMHPFGDDHERVGRPEIEKRGARALGAARVGGTHILRGRRSPLRLERQHHDLLDGTRGALARQVELAHLHEFITPELEAHGGRHAEAVHVHDAAAHRELRHVLHHLGALEADAPEMRGEFLEPPRGAARQFQPRLGQRVRQARALLHGAHRGDEHAHLPAAQPLQCLDALARHLGMRLHLAESFT